MAIAIAFLVPSLLLFSLFTFWPLLRSVYLSFHGSDIIGRPTLFVGLRQYEQLLSSPTFRDVLASTGAFTLLTVVPSLVLGLAIALLLQQRVAGRVPAFQSAGAVASSHRSQPAQRHRRRFSIGAGVRP